MQPGHLIVLNTCPDQETGEKIAKILVEEQLAACVNIVPGITSIYQWQGKIEQDPEVLLIIKTQAERYKVLEERIKQAHPYELPEVISVTIEDGLEAYLKWIDRNTGIKQ
jgi:periplasmic divalent cation tolerance protein